MISRKIYAALACAVMLGRFKPMNGPFFISPLPSFELEVYCSRVRIIPASSVPASTATTEPFDHSVEVERTKRPVTLSSRGPPVLPCVISNQRCPCFRTPVPGETVHWFPREGVSSASTRKQQCVGTRKRSIRKQCSMVHQ